MIIDETVERRKSRNEKLIQETYKWGMCRCTLLSVTLCGEEEAHTFVVCCAHSAEVDL